MVLTIVWLSVILFSSLIPTQGPQIGHPSDTVIHFIIYGITAVIFFRVLRLKVSLTKTVVLSIILASMYGFAIELLQLVLPWREFSFSDEVANIVGAFFFSIIYALKQSFKKFRENNSWRNP